MNKINTETVPVKSHAEILNALPGGRTASKIREQILRVNSAGEYGAVHIYRGQAAPLRSLPGASVERENVAHMAEQERQHLIEFETRVREAKIRPSLLAPLWKHGGFFLGAASRIAGEKSAHLCTEAVETVIDRHYEEQMEYFSDPKDAELRNKISQFRDEENEHKALAQANGAKEAPFYTVASGVIRGLCKIAIQAAKRI